MIARLAVRLERAGLFFREAVEDLVGHRLGDGEFLKARMVGFGQWDLGLRMLLEFVESPVYFLYAREERRDVRALRLSLDEFCYFIGEVFFRMIFH